MRDVAFTNDPLAAAGPGARRFARRCAHATTELVYRPAGLPSVLRLSEADAARLLLIRHAAAGRCDCTTAPLRRPTVA